jgi:ribosomal protein L15
VQMGADPSSVSVLNDKVYACSGKTVKYWNVAELKDHDKDVGSGELTVRVSTFKFTKKASEKLLSSRLVPT